MTCNLKPTVLALIVTFALGVAAPSGATAKPKLTPVPEQYPVTVKGKQTSTHVISLPGGRKMSCTTVNFTGEVKNKAEAEEGRLTTTSAFEGCTAEILGNTDPVTTTMNSCHYVKTTEATTTGIIKEEGWEVTEATDLVCINQGDKVETHVFQDATKHAQNQTLCTYTIHEQFPIVSFDTKLVEKNAEGAGTSGESRARATGIKVQRSVGTSTNCGAAEQTAEYTGSSKVELFNSKGEMLRGKLED